MGTPVTAANGFRVFQVARTHQCSIPSTALDNFATPTDRADDPTAPGIGTYRTRAASAEKSFQPICGSPWEPGVKTRDEGRGV